MATDGQDFQAMNNRHTHVVIMAGGIGSRLWPLSTPEHPKQFIDVLGTGRSLLQMTADRFFPVCAPENFWVVTSERYAGMVSEQLPFIKTDRILTEPVSRNTAPCIAYASWKIHAIDPEADIVVTPADALVTETDCFTDMISEALEFSAKGEDIVTIGITPDRPETGYGYICSECMVSGKVMKVDSFKEKPTHEKAVEYLASGNYYWNAGIFIWSAETIISQIRQYSPGIAAITDIIADSFNNGNEKEMIKTHFPQYENISIDYAVMEKSDSIYMIAGDVGWSDLGSWSSVRDRLPKDKNGNATVGKAQLTECRNCIVHNSRQEETAALCGLDSCIVVCNEGNILVCSTDHEQDIKNIKK